MRKMKTLHLRKKDRNVNLWLLGENEKFEKQHNSQVGIKAFNFLQCTAVAFVDE